MSKYCLDTPTHGLVGFYELLAVYSYLQFDAALTHVTPPTTLPHISNFIICIQFNFM